MFSDGLLKKENAYPKRGDIYTFKVISGEEVIARVESVTSEGWWLKKPLTLNLIKVPGSANQAGVVFVPFIVSHDDNDLIFLKKEGVISFCIASKEAQAGYIKNTTGLDIPTNFNLSE